MNSMSVKSSVIKEQGAAMLLFIIYFMFAGTALALVLANTVYTDVVTLRALEQSLSSQSAADAGIEDAVFRFMDSANLDTQETFMLGSTTVTSAHEFNGVEGRYEISATGTDATVVRNATANLYLGSGASFNFGVQTGNGGFEMGNGSSVIGNVFSNGSVQKVGGGNATIYGDVISGGPTGLIAEIHATGTARARTIRDSTIGIDAYAYEIDGGQVVGNAYCDTINGGAVTGSGGCLTYEPEQGTTSLPITDEEIAAIQQDILDTGTVIAATDPECAGGEYFIDTDITLGFVKIECDFRVKKQGSATVLTLTGSIWVEGNITFEGGPTVEIDGAVGNRTVPIIADNQFATATSGMITVQNGTTFTGSGSPKSYVLLISQNNDAATGGTHNKTAISLGQSSSGDLLTYAGHGRITLGNSVALKEITAYLVSIGNSASITYESGLVNVLFTSGPGGGYTIGEWSDR